MSLDAANVALSAAKQAFLDLTTKILITTDVMEFGKLNVELMKRFWAIAECTHQYDLEFQKLEKKLIV